MARSTKNTRGVRRRATVEGSVSRLPRVSATSKKEPIRRAKAPGGVRAGAGRTPLYGEEKLTEKISARYNGAQSRALRTFFEARGANPNFFMREAALKRAGLTKLGIGLERAYNPAKEGKKLPVPPEDGLQIPVKCTPRQKKALAAYCKQNGVDEGTFVRESTLKEAGLEHLTVAAQHRGEAEALEKATGA